VNLLAIVGPTASGKSSYAITIAQRLDGEVISADSMQAYRGMDIGTAKLKPDEQGGIPHHMLDVWDVQHPLTVVEFRDAARRAIEGVAARQRVPILTGGSGLYIRAITEEFDFPGTDPAVRARWERELASQGAGALHTILAERDPEAAAHIQPTNGRRIVRALEVIELTEAPFRAQLPEPVDRYPTRRIGLRIDRDALDARIERRVADMWEQGFVAEVRALPGLATAPTAAHALGYAPIMDFLAGKCTETQARERTIADTWRFARRQQRWFARDPRIEWFDYDDASLVDTVCASWTST
jgi:tRNA dimethylallyltransferase